MSLRKGGDGSPVCAVVKKKKRDGQVSPKRAEEGWMDGVPCCSCEGGSERKANSVRDLHWAIRPPYTTPGSRTSPYRNPETPDIQAPPDHSEGCQ